ncbi:MAG: DUF4013 domain-containing protein [Anaerolineales bacterium]
MDFAKAITYVFEDRRWPTKIGIAAVIALVPILNFSITGYAVEVIRRLMRRESEALPEWDNLEQYFMDGLRLWVVGIVYSLPLLLLICLLLFPIIFKLLLGTSNEDMQNFLSGFGLLALVCGGLIMFFYSLFLSFLSPAIMSRYASYGSISACLRIGEIWQMVAQDVGGYITLWLGILALTLGGAIVFGVAAVVANILPCIGQVLAILIEVLSVTYLLCASAHLIGQFAVKNVQVGQA